jgi:hypothetical protein
MMEIVLTHEDLEPLRCDTPGCTKCDEVLYFGNRCHPHAPLQAFYVKAAKVLHLACAQCGETITGIQVAERMRVRAVH